MSATLLDSPGSTRVYEDALSAGGSVLIDTVYTKISLCEDKDVRGPSKGKRRGVLGVIKGIFGRCGKTNNGRVYLEEIMRPEVERLQDDIKNRRCYMELDHPSDGKTKLQRACAILTYLEVLDNGDIYGEADLINTPSGQTLFAIAEAQGDIGSSSRGLGTTTTNAEGDKVVSKNFRLMTFDFVAEPATPGAFPKFFMEGREVDAKDLKNMTAADLRRAFPDQVREIEKTTEMSAHMALTEQAEAIANVVAEKVKDATAEAAAKDAASKDETPVTFDGDAKAAADKKCAALKAGGTECDVTSHDDGFRVKTPITTFVFKPAKAAPKAPSEAKPLAAEAGCAPGEKPAMTLDVQKKLESLELENKRLQKLAEDTARIAQDIGFKYKLESSLAGNTHADKVRALVGDLKGFSSVKDLTAKIQESIAQVDRDAKLEEAQQAEKALAAKAAQVSQVAESLETENAALKRSMDGGRRLQAVETARVSGLIESKVAEMRELVLAERDENAKLRKEFSRVVQLAEELAAQVSVERKIAAHPARAAIRKTVAAVRPKTRQDADALIESLESVYQPSREYQEVQDHVRGRSRGALTEDQQFRRQPKAEQIEGVPADVNELLGLAGLDSNGVIQR